MWRTCSFSSWMADCLVGVLQRRGGDPTKQKVEKEALIFCHLILFIYCYEWKENKKKKRTSRGFFGKKKVKKKKGSQSLSTAEMMAFCLRLSGNSFPLPFYHFFFFSGGVERLFSSRLSNFSSSRSRACCCIHLFLFFFFLLGFLRHFLLAVFPIKSLPLTFDGSKKRKFSSFVSSFFSRDLRVGDPSLPMVREKVETLVFSSNPKP